MIIAFEALIKQVKTKSLVSADKSTQVMLEFNSSDETEILNALNVLQRPDSLVHVSIMDDKEISKIEKK